MELDHIYIYIFECLTHLLRPWMPSIPERLTREVKAAITNRQEILHKHMVVRSISKNGKRHVLET